MSQDLDDLFANIDDPAADDFDLEDGGTNEELERMRKAEAAFEKQVIQKMRVLSSRKPELQDRIDAAFWLGEAGDPKAITVLRKIYLETSEAKLKQAAAYALGQFKALDEAIAREPGELVVNALGREENEDVLALMTAIRIEGRFGKRSKFPRRLFSMLNGLLVISLFVLGALFLINQQGDTATEIVPDDRLVEAFAAFSAPDYVVGDAAARQAIDTLRADAAQVRGLTVWYASEFESLAAANAPDCTAEVIVPERAELAPEVAQAYFVIGDAAAHYNSALGNLSIPQNIHDSYCGEPPAEPQTVEIERAQESLSAASSSLDQFETTLVNALPLVMVTPTPAPDTAEPTLGPTPEPTVPPVPTLDPVVERNYVQQLLNLIRDVNGDEGANTLLLQYWTDISMTGRTEGCRLTPPVVPQPLEIPEIVQNADAPELLRGWTQVNTALDALQRGWNLFTDSCPNEGNISQTAIDVGVQSAQSADVLIREANTTLLSNR